MLPASSPAWFLKGVFTYSTNRFIANCALQADLLSQVEKVTSVQGLKSLGNASHIVPRADPAEKDSFFYGDGSVSALRARIFIWEKLDGGLHDVQECLNVFAIWNCRACSETGLWINHRHTSANPHTTLGPRICCRMHPDLSKLRVLAELVIHPLAAAVEEVAAGVTVEERQDARLQGLPPPMIPGVQDSAASSCYMLVRSAAATASARQHNQFDWSLCWHASC